MSKKAISLAGVLLLTWPLLGWSPFLDRLHREEGGRWEAGIENDYIEWKITRAERTLRHPQTGKAMEKVVTVIWKTNLRNVAEKKEITTVVFQLASR